MKLQCWKTIMAMNSPSLAEKGHSVDQLPLYLVIIWDCKNLEDLKLDLVLTAIAENVWVWQMRSREW